MAGLCDEIDRPSAMDVTLICVAEEVDADFVLRAYSISYKLIILSPACAKVA